MRGWGTRCKCWSRWWSMFRRRSLGTTWRPWNCADPLGRRGMQSHPACCCNVPLRREHSPIDLDLAEANPRDMLCMRRFESRFDTCRLCIRCKLRNRPAPICLRDMVPAPSAPNARSPGQREDTRPCPVLLESGSHCMRHRQPQNLHLTCSPCALCPVDTGCNCSGIPLLLPPSMYRWGMLGI